MKRSLFRDIASFFALNCVLFIPFPFHITRVQLFITEFFFGRLIGFVSHHIFGKALADTKVYSDTVSMYVLVLLLFILSVLLGLLLLRMPKWPLYREKIFYYSYRLVTFYLVLQLMKYGADKLFKNQFYRPEPNTLYTPLGMLDKDLLYWSSMGTSHFYNVFLGSLEMLSGVLVFIKRTRLIGLLLSTGILLNVAAVNFGFDISVKLYSLVLVFLTGYLLWPYAGRLSQLLLRPAPVTLSQGPTGERSSPKTFIRVFLPWLAAGIICLEVFHPFIKEELFNGDRAKRPLLQGAYEVREVIIGTDTLRAGNLPIKKLFIHRDSYLIFQDQEDGMQDYKLSYDPGQSIYLLTDYQLNTIPVYFAYRQSDSLLTVKYSRSNKTFELSSKATDWKKLPLLQKSFHWTVDNR